MKKFFVLLMWLTLCAAPVAAQSTNGDFPMPVRGGEISGTIAARDVGDSRLTNHFYTFYAENGDFEIKIESTNFEGDIDLFQIKTLRPLGKITILASGATDTTARTIYFRQREQIVLRVEGRTFGDAAASYKINFSGSFTAAADLPDVDENLTPKVEAQPDSNGVAKVNSAGTIIEVLPPKRIEEKPVETEVAVKIEKPVKTPTPKTPKPRRPVKISAPKTQRVKNPPVKPKRVEPQPIEQTAPTANLRLTILLKDETRIERPMSEIFNVRIDLNQITVIGKNGRIERYKLSDVLKFAIE